MFNPPPLHGIPDSPRAGCDVAALVLAHNLAVLSRRSALDGNPAEVGGR